MAEILLVTGDSSADQYGADLVRALRNLGYQEEIYAAAGPKTEAAGAQLVDNLVDHAVMGFVEILGSLPYYFSLARKLERLVAERPIKAVIMLDFPGFNMRLARRLIRHDVSIFYYIPPQVWAWGKNRIKKLRSWFEQLFVIFPFEEDFYRKHGMNVKFVGHPRQKKWSEKIPQDIHSQLQIDPQKNLLAFFPGSRSQEVDRHLPVMVKTAEQLQAQYPHWEPVFSVASSGDPDKIKNQAKQFKLWSDDSHSLLSATGLAVLASGTVTMEAAFTRTPMVVGYRTSWISYWLARWMVTVDKAAMPVYIDETVEIPELLQQQFTAEKLSETVGNLLKNPQKIKQQKAGLERVVEHYTGLDPADEVARAILDELGLKKL